MASSSLSSFILGLFTTGECDLGKFSNLLFLIAYKRAGSAIKVSWFFCFSLFFLIEISLKPFLLNISSLLSVLFMFFLLLIELELRLTNSSISPLFFLQFSSKIFSIWWSFLFLKLTPQTSTSSSPSLIETLNWSIIPSGSIDVIIAPDSSKNCSRLLFDSPNNFVTAICIPKLSDGLLSLVTFSSLISLHKDNSLGSL